MSQEKVDLRKAAKAGRKAQNKKDKMKKTVSTVILVVIAAVLVGWVGYSIFTRVKNDGGSTQTKEVNLDALQNYMQEIEEESNGTDEETQDSSSGADAGSNASQAQE